MASGDLYCKIEGGCYFRHGSDDDSGSPDTGGHGTEINSLVPRSELRLTFTGDPLLGPRWDDATGGSSSFP